LTRSSAILGTTNPLALIYECETNIPTRIREVTMTLSFKEHFDLALSPQSVKAYANPHRGLSRAG
jgi:hypothetical protein